MHAESYEEAERFVASLSPERELLIADIGSMDINGTYKPLCQKKKWRYVGIDQATGPNVDHVVTEAYQFWPSENAFDVVLCGQMLEHAEMPWRAVTEIARILKPGGFCWLSAPHEGGYHPFPKDCWRIYPDGMRVLLELAGLREIRCYIHVGDTVAWAVKP